MHIITKKVTLLPAPFVGTTLKICVDDGLMFKIRVATLAGGCNHVTIDWGDGTTQVIVGNVSNAAHTYPAPGEYSIRLSDDIVHIGIGILSESSEYYTTYAPMLIGFLSNATQLTAIIGYGLCNCRNLQLINIDKSAITTIMGGVFRNCISLTGDIYFPNVNDLKGTSIAMPFYGCTGITALHFKKANEASITASQAYQGDQDHTLGTGVKDVCRFDL